MGINVSKKDFSLNKITTYSKVNNIKVDSNYDNSDYEEIDYSVEESIPPEKLDEIITSVLLSFLGPYGGIALVAYSAIKQELLKKFKIKSITSGGSSFDTIVETEEGYRYCFNNWKLEMIKDNKGNVYRVNEDGSITCAAYLKENLNIFNDANTEYEQYGGNQMSFSKNNTELIARDDINTIFDKYFTNLTLEQKSSILNNITGSCGYIALTNAIFKKFIGKEQEFKDTFGFDMYRLDSNGHAVYNYEPLALDLILSSRITNQNATVDDLVNGEHVGASTRQDRIDIINLYNEKYNLNLEITSKRYKDISIISVDQLQHYLDHGFTIIIGASGYDLYDYNTGNLHTEDGGGHAMTLVGFTEDGRPIVSSWGKKYILSLDNLDFENGDFLSVDFLI